MSVTLNKHLEIGVIRKILSSGTGGENANSYLNDALAELSGVLARLADSGTTARLAYAEILEELLVRYEETPNGAQLMEFVGAFNRKRESTCARLPLGTAGTAAEAVATFRNKVAKGYRTRLPLSTVSPDLAQRVAAMFDEIVGELRAALSQSAIKEMAIVQAAHQQELERIQSLARKEVELLEADQAALSSRLGAANDNVAHLTLALEQKNDRIGELAQSLDSVQSRLQQSASKEAVAVTRGSLMEEKLRALEVTNARLTAAESDERKKRLLTLDENRQMGLALEATKQQNQSLNLQLESIQSKANDLTKRVENGEQRISALLKRVQTAQLPSEPAGRQRRIGPLHRAMKKTQLTKK
ncbi:hypothetical protein Rfer_4345 (plasmid) [Rhodoferax ferrireducens T118]|uniref:Uncharacterized protein n=1 Tax=Albidiferax ferrireducens (strain ATCC BAA-621 / DSM 15236 / T118) TaxID=338969 RepID=Q21QB4_ALBFT|nr:hypothetical protein [Rhodoferax ferrireducens]ABD72031.1 hypothetical protein Rfer_4345 [Rhodoferax ferrireducens T118]